MGHWCYQEDGEGFCTEQQRQPQHAKPAAVAGVAGGRWMEAALQSPSWPGNKPTLPQCHHLQNTSDTAVKCGRFGSSRTQPHVAALSSASPWAQAVLHRPLVPTAVTPTCFQTFNLLTLRRPWEAGKVVLSSFSSRKHKWFPYKYLASWQKRWDPNCIYLSSWSGQEGRSLPPTSISAYLALLCQVPSYARKTPSALSPLLRDQWFPHRLPGRPVRMSMMKHSSWIWAQMCAFCNFNAPTCF